MIDWTGRAFHQKSKGRIPPNVEGILNLLNFKEDFWLDAITNYGSLFTMFARRLKGLKGRVLSTSKKWLKGTASNKQIFEST